MAVTGVVTIASKLSSLVSINNEVYFTSSQVGFVKGNINLSGVGCFHYRYKVAGFSQLLMSVLYTIQIHGKSLASMSQKKLLVAGGSHAEIPIIRAARELGYFVISSGSRQEDLGHAHSNQYIAADYSDAEAMLEIAIEQNVSGICSACNDFSAISSSVVAYHLGLPGHHDPDTCRLIHHKDKFREFCLNNGYSVPEAISVHSSEQAVNAASRIGYPVIVKPVDLTGGKGISVVSDSDHLIAAIEKAASISRQTHLVVEKFVNGRNYGMSIMLRSGKVAFWMAEEEYYHVNPYMVSAASTPTALNERTISQLLEQTESMASDLNLVDGIFHIQFIVRKD